MTPEQLAKESEHSHQVALMQWCALNAHNDERLLLLFAIPNGGERNKIVASKLKAEGVRSGVPDLFLPVAAPKYERHATVTDQIRHWHCGLFIEMKKPSVKHKRKTPTDKWDTGGVSNEQKIWLANLERQGYKVVVCYSWYEAANEIKFYLTGKGIDDD